MNQPRTISIDKGEVPEYVKNRPDLGRSLWLAAHYDHGSDQWTVYIPQGTGPLFIMHPIGMSEGSYLSTGPQCDDDLRDPLATLVYQHLSFPQMIPVIECLVSDILAGLSTLHNYFILVDHGRRHKDERIRSVVATIIESSLTIHRSFYDLLNRVVQKMVEISNIQGVSIPDSFRKVLDQGADGMSKKYCFPPALVEYYLSRKQVFHVLRAVRDQVVHHGKSPQLIYRFDDGFGINPEMGILAPLDAIGVWREESLRENGIGGVLALFAFLARDMLQAGSSLATAISSFQTLPTPVSPGASIFLRSELMFHCQRIDDYIAKPWRDAVEGFTNEKAQQDKD